MRSYSVSRASLVAGFLLTCGCFSPTVGGSQGSSDETESTTTPGGSSGPTSAANDDLSGTSASTSGSDLDGTSGTMGASSGAGDRGDSGSARGCTVSECSAGLCVPDFEAAPDHCGSCGVVCPSEQCDAGYCTPSTLAFVTDIRRIDAGGGWAFVSSGDGSVTRVGPRGAKTRTVVVSVEGAPITRADESSLYVYSSDVLGRYSHAGELLDDLYVEPEGESVQGPRDFLLADGRMFWTQRWSGDGLEDHLVSVAISGGDYIVHGVTENRISPLAVVAGQLYFKESQLSDLVGRGPTLGAFGTQIEVLIADGDRDIRRIRVSDTGIYFIEPFSRGSHALVNVSLDGGTVTTLTTLDSLIDVGGGMALGSDSVYWTADSQLYGCQVGDCTPVPIGGGGADGAVAVGNGWLYWAAGSEVKAIPISDSGA